MRALHEMPETRRYDLAIGDKDESHAYGYAIMPNGTSICDQAMTHCTEYYVCTRERGHEMPHVAHAGARILCFDWEDEHITHTHEYGHYQ